MILIAGQASAVFTLTNVAVVPEVFGTEPMDQGTAPHHRARYPGQPDHQGNGHRLVEAERPGHLEPAVPDHRGDPGAGGHRRAGPGPRGTQPPPTVPRSTGRYGPGPPGTSSGTSWPNPTPRCSIGGSLLFWSGVGSTAYVAILFFERVLHAGASAQTIAGLATSLPVFFIGIALGIPLSRKLTPMQLAIGAPLDRCRAGRGPVLRHPPVAGGGPRLHRSAVHRRLHHRDGPTAPPAAAAGRRSG